MYRTVENTFTAPGLGTAIFAQNSSTFVAPGLGSPSFGQNCLQNITVIAQCTAAITGAPTLALDLQFGDNVPPSSGLVGNPDTAFASGAGAVTGTVPVTLNATLSAVVLNGGCCIGARVNVGGTLTAGSLKVQIAVRDMP